MLQELFDKFNGCFDNFCPGEVSSSEGHSWLHWIKAQKFSTKQKWFVLWSKQIYLNLNDISQSGGCFLSLLFTHSVFRYWLWTTDLQLQGWCKPSYVINVCRLLSYTLCSSLFILSTPACRWLIWRSFSLFVFVVILIQTAPLSQYINIF